MIVPDFHGMWNIPPPAPFFTGRENVIANMTQHLKVRGCGVFSQVIAGQGGVGKTQVGFAYAEAMQEYYGKRGYLIDSETRQTILTACIELMVVLQFYKELGIDDGKGMADVRTQLSRFRPSQIQNHLIQRLLLLPKILLILDNVEDKELVTPFLSPDMLRVHDVLLTSRLRDWGAYPVENLDILPLGEARKYIQRVMKELYHQNVSDVDANALAESLHCLPLALAQAVYTIQDAMSIPDYIQLYNESLSERKLLLNSCVFDQDNYKKTVFTTWDISRRKIERLSAKAARVYAFISLLSAENMPKSFFNGVLCESMGDVHRTLKILADHSLIRYTSGDKPNDSIVIHRLQQEVVRIHLSDQEQILGLLNDVVAAFDCFGLYDGTIESLVRARPYVPHVREMLHLAEEHGLDASPQLFKLYAQLGSVLGRQDNYDEARPYFDKAKGLSNTVRLDQQSYLRFLSELGYYAQYSNINRIEVAEKVLKSYEDHVSKKPEALITDTEIYLMCIASAMCIGTGNYPKANEISARLVKLKQMQQPQFKERLAIAYIDYAITSYKIFKRYDTAIDHFLKCDEIYTEYFKNAHPDQYLFHTVRGEMYLSIDNHEMATHDFMFTINNHQRYPAVVHAHLYLSRSYLGMAKILHQSEEKEQLEQAKSYANASITAQKKLGFDKVGELATIHPKMQEALTLLESIEDKLACLLAPTMSKFGH